MRWRDALREELRRVRLGATRDAGLHREAERPADAKTGGSVSGERGCL